MSMFFRYKGSLSFENKAQAAEFYRLLTNSDDSWFSFAQKDLELSEKTLKFRADGNFNSYISCEKTKDLIYQAARTAVKGSVKADEGDSEKSLWNKELIPASGQPSVLPSIKTYQFSGRLEFASEPIAKFHCKRLLTNPAKSAFAKFERVAAGDRRDVRFDGKHLIIESQLTLEGGIFRKTKKLLDDIRANAAHENLEIKEVNARKAEKKSDQRKAPTGWINDLTRDIFYRFSGSVLFHTAEAAQTAYQKLLSDERSVFAQTGKYRFPVYISNGSRLVFDDIGACHRSLLNSTEDVINETVEAARSGKITYAFSYSETMDPFVPVRITPAKVRKWNKFVNKK